MIVISSPTSIPNEIRHIELLFLHGLKLFHVRKPDFIEKEMKLFLSKISVENRGRLVLHQHHHLAAEFGINRLHFTEKRRKTITEDDLNYWANKGFCLSTSVHSIEDYNRISELFSYCFLSPVFDSISKPDYLSRIDFAEALKLRSKKCVKLVALGGLNATNIQQAYAYGFDQIALLGSIWNSNQPIENYILCKQTALLY
jgi:thiamine-phosphate pyrophosphorylase